MLYYSRGSKTDIITPAQTREALREVLERLNPRKKILAIPPDYTRLNSYAGEITTMLNDLLGDRLEQHDDTRYFDTAARTARAASDEHDGHQDGLGLLRP